MLAYAISKDILLNEIDVLVKIIVVQCDGCNYKEGCATLPILKQMLKERLTVLHDLIPPDWFKNEMEIQDTLHFQRFDIYEEF